MSRPTKLTAELAAALADAVRLGLPLSLACERAGVGVSTVEDWIARGEGRHKSRQSAPLYAEFAAALKRARAEDQARRIARIEKAAKGGAVTFRRTTTKRDGSVVTEERFAEPQWTADAWHLE